MSVLATGDTVKLTTAPKGLAPYRGKVGTVRSTTESAAGIFADVELTIDPATGATMHLRDVYSCYLSKVAPEAATGEKKSQKRRGVLNLHEPKDDRSEKEKQAEAEAFLLSMGYAVLGVGQHRSAAKCYECAAGIRNGKKLFGGTVPRNAGVVLCPFHKKPVYSPDTGSSEGVSDWQIRSVARWPRHAVLLVEWKRNNTARRRTKQIELSANGWYPIVDNLNSLCAEIVHFEDSILMMECLPEILEKALLAK